MGEKHTERDEYFKALPGDDRLLYTPRDTVRIGDRFVGPNYKTFIVGEIGANHHGEKKIAMELIKRIADAGADAAKVQLLRPNSIASDVEMHTTWRGRPVTGPFCNFYESAAMPYEWTEELAAHAKKCGIMFFGTPFDTEAVDVLDAAGVPVFKVASYELDDDLFLAYIASKGKPMILSTGQANMENIGHAINVAKEAGNDQIVLLHCTSMYPPPMKVLNLRAIPTMDEAFKIPVGYSDHSKPGSNVASIAAVTLGARVIERHVTLDRRLRGNDNRNSVNISIFGRYVREIRDTEEALSGDGTKQPVSIEGHNGDEIFELWAHRSVFAMRDMETGEVVTDLNGGYGRDITTLRELGGIKPKDFPLFRGKRLIKPVKAREKLTLGHFVAEG